MRTLIMVGPDKAGSTWVHRFFGAHPAIAESSSKELFFFDGSTFSRGIRWYRRQFRLNAESRYLGEVCHEYLFSPMAAQRIAEYDPDARLVVGLRDPAERALSSYLYMLRQGRVSMPFGQAIREIDELIDHGRYGKHLAEYRDRFPPDQIYLLDFARLATDPQEVADGLAQFLNLPPIQLPEEIRSRVRPASEARSRILATKLRSLAIRLRMLGAHRLVGSLKDAKWVERWLFRPFEEGKRPKLEPDDRAYIMSQCAGDLKRLDELFTVDFGARWLNKFTEDHGQG